MTATQTTNWYGKICDSLDCSNVTSGSFYVENVTTTTTTTSTTTTASTTITSTTTTIPSNDTVLPVIYASIYPTTGNYSLINITATDNVMVDQILLYTNGEYTGRKDCSSPVCNWEKTVYRTTPGNYTYWIFTNDTSDNSATEYLYAFYWGPQELTGDLDGNGEVSLGEVIDIVNMWVDARILLGYVIDAINNWGSG